MFESPKAALARGKLGKVKEAQGLKCRKGKWDNLSSI